MITVGIFENTNQQVITAQMLENLPEPVQRYMDFSGVVGKPCIAAVRLE